MDLCDASRIRVLIADDEPKLRSLVANALRSLGCTVLEAQDGLEAWSLAQGRRPDVVVLDVMMPGMSGWDVCRRIKTDPACADPRKGPPKVLMLTGIGEHLNEMTSPLFSADAWLDKPFSLRTLTTKVLELAGLDAPAPASLPPDVLPDEPLFVDAPARRPVSPAGPYLKKASPSVEALGALAQLDEDEPETRRTKGMQARAKAAKAARAKTAKAKKAAAKPAKVKAPKAKPVKEKPAKAKAPKAKAAKPIKAAKPKAVKAKAAKPKAVKAKAAKPKAVKAKAAKPKAVKAKAAKPKAKAPKDAKPGKAKRGRR